MTQLPIGILSGTFDPIHLGHIHLATTIYKLCHLQKIVLVPCYQSPLRIPPVATAKDRYKMAQLAIKNLPYVSIDNYEILRPTLSYTYNTVKYLHKKNNKTVLALIIGTDAFNRFLEWRNWQTILELVHLIVVNRPNQPQTPNKKLKKIITTSQIFTPQQLQKKSGGLIYFADIKPSPIAATEIRALIKQQKDASHLLPKEVWQYIKEKKLYNE